MGGAMPTATVVHIYNPRPTVTVVAFNIQEKESERISKVEIKTESKQTKNVASIGMGYACFPDYK